MTKLQRWQIRLFFLIWFIICYSPFIHQGPFHFLLLNTILAYLPIEISFQISRPIIKESCLFWFFLIIWLLFYPNATYILTDLFHLSLLNPYDSTTGLLRNSMTMWLNFLMLLVSALVSAWLGFITMFNVVDDVLDKIKTHSMITKRTLILIITILNSIGVYIGRFLRIHTVYLFLSPRLFINPIINMWTPKMINFIIIITFIQLIFYWLMWLTRQQMKNDLTS